MPDISRTTNFIIVNAFRVIGEVSPDETPTSSMINTGLDFLNLMLDSMSTETVMIPFYKKLNFDLTAGKAEYTIAPTGAVDIQANKIIELGHVNLIQNDISYPVRVTKLHDTRDVVRYTKATGLPDSATLINNEFYSTIEFYRVPDFNYSCEIFAKFMLDDIKLFDVLDEVPRRYYQFLIYGLGRILSGIYQSAGWTPQQENTYSDELKKIKASAQINTAIYTDNIFMNDSNLQYSNLPGTT
jgi:hypothetical protein